MSEKAVNAVKVSTVVVRRHFDGEDFLKTVRKHPYLYDKNEPKFKDTRYKEQQWAKIGTIYSMKGDVCYNKFKNMKDRYTKLLSAVEKAVAAGDATETIKGIRWRLFPIMHDLLSETPFSKPLPIDLKALFESKNASSDNEDSGSRDDLVHYQLVEEEEMEDTEAQDGSSQQQIIITDEDGNRFYQTDEYTLVEQDDSQPRYIISATNSTDNKFTFAGEPLPGHSLLRKRLKRPLEKQSPEADEKLNVNLALSWATQIIDAVESKRQKQIPKNSPEEEEVIHFTSYLKHRLLKYERSQRLKVIHDIETILHKEEQKVIHGIETVIHKEDQ